MPLKLGPIITDLGSHGISVRCSTAELTQVLIRIALAFENLTPVQVCQAFGRALERPCKYVFDRRIEVKVPVPNGYRQQLAGIEILFGMLNAPYFPGPEFDFVTKRKEGNDTITGRKSHDSSRNAPDGRSGNVGSKAKSGKLTDEARSLWEGYRGIEEYAREVFPVEEEANGKTWMINKVVST